MASQDKNTSGKDLRLKGRDLIATGIFLALYFILMTIPMVIPGIHPFLWVLFPGFAGILCAIPFMLLCARVQKPFCVLIMGVVICLLFGMMCYFTLALVTILLTSIIAEIIRWRTGYASYLGNAVAYVFFAYGMTCSPLPIWLYNELPIAWQPSSMPTRFWSWKTDAWLRKAPMPSSWPKRAPIGASSKFVRRPKGGA